MNGIAELDKTQYITVNGVTMTIAEFKKSKRPAIPSPPICVIFANSSTGCAKRKEKIFWMQPIRMFVITFPSCSPRENPVLQPPGR